MSETSAKGYTTFTREQQDAMSERICAANLMADLYTKYTMPVTATENTSAGNR